jgi:hypothetical protein
LRAASLRRKIGILRESVVAALQSSMRRGQPSAAGSSDKIRSSVSLLRRATGEVEELGARCERSIDAAAAEVPDVIERAASRLIGSWSRNDGGPLAPGQMVRDVVAHFVGQTVKRLQDDLVSFAAQLQISLKQSAAQLGLPDMPGDDDFIIRGTPIFDPQPFTVVVSRPSVSFLLGRRFTLRHVAKRIENQLGPPFHDALHAYWIQLKEWCRAIVGQLRRQFESCAEVHRARATQALHASDGGAGDLQAIQQSLAYLQTDPLPEARPSADPQQVPEVSFRTT